MNMIQWIQVHPVMSILSVVAAVIAGLLIVYAFIKVEARNRICDLKANIQSFKNTYRGEWSAIEKYIDAVHVVNHYSGSLEDNEVKSIHHLHILACAALERCVDEHTYRYQAELRELDKFKTSPKWSEAVEGKRVDYTLKHADLLERIRFFKLNESVDALRICLHNDEKRRKKQDLQLLQESRYASSI